MKNRVKSINFGEMLDHTFGFPELYPELNRNSEKLISSHGAIQNRLYEAVVNNDPKAINEIKKYLSEHFRSTVPLSENALISIRYHAVTFSMLCLNCALAGGVVRKVAFAYHFSLIKTVDLMETEESIKTTIVNMPVLYAKLVEIFGIPDHFSLIVKNAMAIITSSINKRITVEALCAKLYVSKGTLTKAFKKENGITVSQYIDKIKLEVSKILLTSSDTSIESIANFLAFSSINHFSFYFKKKMGINASEYRKANNTGVTVGNNDSVLPKQQWFSQ